MGALLKIGSHVLDGLVPRAAKAWLAVRLAVVIEG